MTVRHRGGATFLEGALERKGTIYKPTLTLARRHFHPSLAVLGHPFGGWAGGHGRAGVCTVAPWTDTAAAGTTGHANTAAHGRADADAHCRADDAAAES